MPISPFMPPPIMFTPMLCQDVGVNLLLLFFALCGAWALLPPPLPLAASRCALTNQGVEPKS